MKAPKGSGLMGEALSICLAADPTKLQWGETGPDLLTKLLRDRGQSSYGVHPDVFCPIDWWRWRDVGKTNPIARYRNSVRTRRAYGIHLWHEMWRRTETPKDQQFSAGSLYETLKRRYGVTAPTPADADHEFGAGSNLPEGTPAAESRTE
jgi:hypothetical protein